MLGDQLILQYYYRVSGSREVGGGGGHGGSAPRGSLLEKVIVSRVKSPSKTHVHLNQVQILADPESASPTCHSPSAPRTPRPVSDLLPVSPGQSPSLPSLLVVNGSTRGHRRPRDACIVRMCARTCRYPHRKQRPPPSSKNLSCMQLK